MKILFDTNVLVAAFLGSSSCYEIIEDAIDGHKVYYTHFILAEFREVFQEKFHFSQLLIEEFVFLIHQFFINGETALQIPKLCRDPDDDQVLADALINKINFIITGDKDLLTIKDYKGIQIINPRNYWHIS
jgi:putative PIN family toxin of toxin-antitoxin system